MAADIEQSVGHAERSVGNKRFIDDRVRSDGNRDVITEECSLRIRQCRIGKYYRAAAQYEIVADPADDGALGRIFTIAGNARTGKHDIGDESAVADMQGALCNGCSAFAGRIQRPQAVAAFERFLVHLALGVVRDVNPHATKIGNAIVEGPYFYAIPHLVLVNGDQRAADTKILRIHRPDLCNDKRLRCHERRRSRSVHLMRCVEVEVDC